MSRNNDVATISVNDIVEQLRLANARKDTKDMDVIYSFVSDLIGVSEDGIWSMIDDLEDSKKYAVTYHKDEYKTVFVDAKSPEEAFEEGRKYLPYASNGWKNWSITQY